MSMKKGKDLKNHNKEFSEIRSLSFKTYILCYSE